MPNTNSQSPAEQPGVGQRFLSGARFFHNLFYGVLLTGIGVPLVIYWGWPTLMEARASNHWPAAQGEILESDVKRKTNRDGGVVYFPHIVYDYQIGEVRLQNNQVSIGGSSDSATMADSQGLVNRYPVGKEVTVYYDPLRPERSVLTRGANWNSFLPLGFGLIALLMGISSLLYPFRHIFAGLFRKRRASI